jgi:transcriptional antiterminator RfaH
MKCWYLIQTKTCQERLARENLERQGYTIYLPFAEIRRRRRGKTIRVIDPMFPRYLFIYLSDETDDWRPIRSTLGVTTLVRFGQVLAKVPGNLIASLRDRENDQGIQIIETPDYQSGDKVRIAEGPMEGYEGIFQCKTGKERVTVLLQIAEKAVSIQLSPEQIEPFN